MLALGMILDLGWWAGLASVAWLLTDKRPAYRVLGAWWLILSGMTPLYHPYARLWLPLHCAGWILLSGAAVRLGPIREAVIPALDRASLLDRSLLARAAVTLFCLIVAKAQWSEKPPQPVPLRAFYQPTDTLRAAAAAIARSPFLATPHPGTVRLLARRPVAFYFALNGVRFRLVESLDEFMNGEVSTTDLPISDGVLVDPDAYTRFVAPESWTAKELWVTRLDPVTRLDVDPGVVYHVYSIANYLLTLYVPHFAAPFINGRINLESQMPKPK
jgi:hypothetical protein